MVHPGRPPSRRDRAAAPPGLVWYPPSDRGVPGRWLGWLDSFAEVAWFSEHLASFGPDVIVREPADLRDAVITRLKGALA